MDKTIHQLPFNLSLKPLSNFIQPFFMSTFQPLLRLYPYNFIKLYIKYQTQHQTSYQIPDTSSNFISNTKHITKLHIKYQTQHQNSYHIPTHTKYVPKLHIIYQLTPNFSYSKYQTHQLTSYQLPNISPNFISITKNITKLHIKYKTQQIPKTNFI